MQALWKGRLPLARAFWEHAVGYGALASLAATGGAFAALALDLPGALALLAHLLPLPYLFVCVVGVFRSARCYAGPPIWVNSAKVAVVIWAALMVVV